MHSIPETIFSLLLRGAAGDSDPSTAGCSPPQALSNFSTACPGAAGITEAGLLRCQGGDDAIFPPFLQGIFKSLGSHRATACLI